jgi:DNA-binding response OmpR family regulator
MKKILVIDDEAPIRNVLKIHLQNASYEVTTAATGKEGIELALSNSFDLILCDLKLTDMSGIDIIRTVRVSNKTIPMLAISGFINDDVINEVNTIDSVGYLSKPFLKDELLKAVNSIFGVN